jgi:hypothetical protein
LIYIKGLVVDFERFITHLQHLNKTTIEHQVSDIAHSGGKTLDGKGCTVDPILLMVVMLPPSSCLVKTRGANIEKRQRKFEMG